jgi:hypothetical protein
MRRAAFAAVLLAFPAVAQTPAEAPTLAWLQGEWVGEGKIFGRPARVTLSVTPALLDSATTLVYRVEADATDNQPAFRFEGRSTYRIGTDSKVSGQWADSHGNFHPLAGRIRRNSLTVTWGEARTEIGQSSYALASDGTLTVTDTALNADGLRVFATGSYRRK